MNKLRPMHSSGCTSCGLQKICFPTGLVRSDMLRLDSIVERTPRLSKGQHLYKAGQTFDNLYAIKAGGVKVYNITQQCEEQVIGFYLPGDVIGMDGLQDLFYQCNALALENTSVCTLPFDQLERLALQIPALNHQLLCLMSRGINDSRIHSEILSKRNADQRVAYFIWYLSQRFLNRGYKHTEFRFGVLHREVAQFLGLTPETFSRILAKLSEQKIVQWKRKDIEIIDMAALSRLADENQLISDKCAVVKRA
ncbi:helix-turn-helix domain-containing protein [Thiomicrospira sp. R3]|uniref:helix-turn-helix domain-containing protein n=1 Tax=Thiomicrospira sp. R3 TaxID=3035472 RepID=UPI00259B1D02|nr:helix-turn-helix domain-containing protein [Thiomicrospira sp. R3]WFE69014.1 helix-turn-helix domain-containing protein [Thiomicrospira sp. R3]